VDKSEANCRQVFGRARQHLDTHQARYKASTEQSQTLLRSFLAATREGDLDQLVDLLAADAVFAGDGGGKANAIREPLYGRDQIAAFLLSIFEPIRRHERTLEPVLVNGGPGIVTHDAQGRIIGVLSLEVLDGVIQTVRSVVNPDKLQHLGTISDFLRLPPNEQM
jgi:RNA polymerase sigma-70 factor (ECF subfamily)